MGDAAPTLLDPTQYTVIPHVPVLDECTLYVPSKNDPTLLEPFEVTREFLERVCYNGNRREAETGDLTPLVIGKTVAAPSHTVKGVPEVYQPEIVGYARNWVVDRFLNTNKVAAHADFWIKNSEVERVRKFPRRSAEVWRGRAEIDPIALLGATTPERDLGLLPLALNRQADQEISCSVTCNRALDMPADTDNKPTAGMDGADKGGSTPASTDLVSVISKLVAKVSDLEAKLDQALMGGTGGDAQTQPGGGAEGAPGVGGEPGDEMSDDEIAKLIQELEEQGGEAGAAEAGEGKEEQPRKTDAPAQAMGYPGGQNTFTPGESSKKLSRDEAYAEIARLRDEVTNLRLQRDRDAVTAKVKELEAQGVLFEDGIEKEINDVMALPADMRPILLSRMEKQYKRKPGTGVNPAVLNSANIAPDGITQEQRDQVVKLARESGDSFEVAFKKTFGRFPWEPARI